MSERHYHPQFKDFRISKELTEGLHWIWERKLDGTWAFILAKSEQAASNFVSDKTFLHEDGKYTYWR